MTGDLITKDNCKKQLYRIILFQGIIPHAIVN